MERLGTGCGMRDISQQRGRRKHKAVLPLDSDYQTPDTIQRRQKSAASHGVQLHIWKRKEIENYFLVPTAILRLIQRSIQPTGEKPTLQDVEKKLDEVAERLRMDTFNAMATAFQDEDRSGGVTGANKKPRRVSTQFGNKVQES